VVVGGCVRLGTLYQVLPILLLLQTVVIRDQQLLLEGAGTRALSQ